MGATNFFVSGSGNGAAEVFKRLVDAAKYAHGHSGYTGTIAEKESFVMIPFEAKTNAEVNAFAIKLIDDCDERIDDKWGPAGCVELPELDSESLAMGHSCYMFFGWASE